MKHFLPVAAALLLSNAALCAQTSAKPGDLNGVWYMYGGGGDSRVGNKDEDGKLIVSVFPNRPESQWSNEKLPFTAAGRAAFEANRPSKGPRMAKTLASNDPIWEANPIGLYRNLIYSRNIELDVLPDKVIQLFGFDRRFRIIYTDGRPVPDDVGEGPFWYGYSVGHWEGDTLVVTTLALDSRAWMDEWGTPISDNARIVERWKRTAKNKLQLTITVNDPDYYSKPWTSAPVIYTLMPKAEPNEVIYSAADEKAFEESVRNPALSTHK